MLIHTFCHIQGIGHVTERRLWEAGITQWDLLHDKPHLVRVPTDELRHLLAHSRQALQDNPHFFTGRLRRADGWRIFPHFRNKTAYLDIETSGMGPETEITTIALYDGVTLNTYVQGRNLDEFIADISSYDVLVTYNGIGFDVPFIENYFTISLPHAHIDLRYVLARLGCRGGLKGCEKQFGIHRGLLDGCNGADAVRLWHIYRATGNEAALATLLAYNIEDTVNLEKLMVEAYNRNVENTPFGASLIVPCPAQPPLPYLPDYEVLRALADNPPERRT